MTSDNRTANVATPLQPTSGYGPLWSMRRHVLIAAAAENLMSQSALDAVAEILAPIQQNSISQIADWSDKIKRAASTPRDEETRAFLRDPRNQDHKNWHHMNLPLGAVGYDRTRYPEFTRNDDVVQALIRAIKELSGPQRRLSKINALRVLVHLVGDVHQPLHVACAYIGKDGGRYYIERDAEIIIEHDLDHDIGGNDCILPGQAGSLHSYWDGSLGGYLDLGHGPNAAIHSPHKTNEADIKEFAGPLVASPLSGIDDNSPILKAPITWANKSLECAKIAYEDLKIVKKNIEGQFDVEWTTSKEEYDSKCGPLVLERAQSATRNLAFLLNKIFQ